jgi:hypothetical protein
MGRFQPLPVTVPAVFVVAIPIMNLAQSVVATLPLTVSLKLRSVRVWVTSMPRMSAVPSAVAIPGSMSPAGSL